MYSGTTKAFTLIELSIVLIIIGLIVGGVLVGRDLIAAAAMRAQITQIDKFNSATNTFYSKYGYFPGDLPAAPAAQFGFKARGTYAGEGDGNGVLEGVWTNGPINDFGLEESSGETVMFWVDLSTANLIEGGFNTASEATPVVLSLTSTPAIGSFFPAAKLGNGNYIYVYNNSVNANGGNGLNYFGLSTITAVANLACGDMSSSPAVTVSQAYNIDKKIDDGLPNSGAVLAQYINGPIIWAGVSAGDGTCHSGAGTPTTTATSGSATTCYDNSNSTNPMTYSVTTNNGTGKNCALSFKFQ